MEDNEAFQQLDIATDQSYQADEISGEVFTPLEQQTIIFYDKPLIVVRLPDGRPAVVLRYLCDNMSLDRSSQVRRIQRTKAIAKDLVHCLINTSSGTQKMPCLILRSMPYWLLGIDPSRARQEMQGEILRYQEEAVDVLYAWAQSPHSLPTPHEQKQLEPSLQQDQQSTLVPFSVVFPLEAPDPNASHSELATYHEMMSLWHRWQADHHRQQWRGEVEEWRGSVESRLEAREAITNLIPEILERLGPATLTSQHYRRVQALAKQLHLGTNKPYPTIYDDLKTAFEKPRIEDLLEEDWAQIEHWFQRQIDQAKRKH